MNDDHGLPIESEDIVRAIRAGEVDAFVITQAHEERIYSLRSADLLYRAMIEDMKDGAVALDPSGLIVYCNAYFAQLVKADRASLVGAKILPFVPGDGDEFFARLREQAQNGTRRRELELRAADGTLVPVLAVMNRIRVEEGGDVYCLVVTDLTDQKQREQLLAEGRRKDDFLAMLAHELRNPIAPIRYAVERLGMGEVTPARLQWARDVIARQTEQLTRLVDDLLDVSRIARGKVTLNLDALDVDAVVSRAVDALRPIIESRRQVLKITRSGGRLRVRGDATRLTQAISNLLHNAAKFTPEGGHISVEVGVERAADGAPSVRIAVADDGIGMAPGVLQDMFKLFSQADAGPGRAHGGLGIGLTLVRSFVEMHGGTVTGTSEGAGRGSTFVVRLPLLAEPSAAQPTLGEPPAAAVVVGARRKILVVDDNRDVAESLSFWLADAGHEVRVAHSVAEGVRQAERFRPHVLFVDIGLPDGSGYELARRLRSLPELRRAVMVAVTGYGQEDDRRRSKEAGFDLHWLKPLTPEMLSALLVSLADAAPGAARDERAT